MNLLTLLVGIEKDAEGKQLDPVRRAMAMKSLRRAAAQEFGGYTLTHCEGGWVNDAGLRLPEGESLHASALHLPRKKPEKDDDENNGKKNRQDV